MRIYLAARYSRRFELCGYRDQLRAMGHDVQAVWLNGEHQIDDKGVPIGDSGESLVEGKTSGCATTYPHLPHDQCDGKPNAFRIGERLSPDGVTGRAAALRQKFAHDDFRDVTMCDLCISFTEPPRSEGGRSRGGRHVEFGIALGLMKRVWIVGYRENIFHWLEDVRFFPTWDTLKIALAVEGQVHP